MKTSISLIAAASANKVIGLRGRLPWHLPNDFEYFKETTMGKPVVMGRRTWDSIGWPLPGRRNLVLTRDPALQPVGAEVAASVDAVIDMAGDADELMVIGGGQVYELFLDRASRVYLTHVAAEIDGDAFFPSLDADEWTLSSTDVHRADDRHAFDYEFRVYDRF